VEERALMLFGHFDTVAEFAELGEDGRLFDADFQGARQTGELGARSTFLGLGSFCETKLTNACLSNSRVAMAQ
jgi:hypothetical protein